MLTNTIAEIRTYGEGFIIVDQSPSSVDIAAIKNTNTKIVLRTPEAHDREAIGRSIGLTTDQVEEIAKLPSGVAVVYQNNWISPVLTMINKANVTESVYQANNLPKIMTAKSARTRILRMLMQPWIDGKPVDEKALYSSIQVLDLRRSTRKRITELADDYLLFGGHLIWEKENLGELQTLVREVLGINDNDLIHSTTPDSIRRLVRLKLGPINNKAIEEICFLLTYGEDKYNDI